MSVKKKFLSAAFLVVLPFSVFFAYNAFAIESQPIPLPPGLVQSAEMPVPLSATPQSFTPPMEMPASLPIPSPDSAVKKKNGNLELTRLGTLGGSWSRPYAINNKGQIIGVSALAGDQFAHGFLWEKGVMKDLGDIILPIAINNNGTIFANNITNQGGVPVLWENGQIKPMNTLNSPGMPFAINRWGHAVGSLETPTKEPDSDRVFNRAFLFRNNTIVDLGTLGGENSEAKDINSRTQIVGYSTTKEGKARAFLFTKGSMRDIGTLGGDYSSAVAINDKGEIAGMSTTSTGTHHGFLYKNGKMKDIGFFGMEGYVKITDMNNNGEIVGMIQDMLEMPKAGVATMMGDLHAFVWKNGVLTDLSALIRLGDGEKIEGIYGINNSRQIIGTIQIDGQDQGFVIKIP